MAIAPETTRGTDRSLQDLAKRHLWMHFARMGAYADHEVPIIARGEGCYVWDEHGNRYLDGLSGLFCVNALELRPSARDRARGEDRLADSGRPRPRLLHLRRLGGG
jgi:hypothetical protein